MKETFKNIKELLKNPRYKAITLLGIYAIFFIFVYLVINSINQIPNSNEIIETSIFQSETQYRLTYNTDVYTFDNGVYTFNDLNYTDETLIINYDLITPIILEQLINDSTLLSTNHIGKFDTRTITIKQYEQIVNNVEVENENQIIINIFKNELVSKMEIILEEYKGYNILWESE